MYYVTYLHHSGFLVETEHYYLIFDYYTQGGRNNFISIEQFTDKKIIVFASHGHNDHFDSTIFSWQKENPSIQYVLSDDISLWQVKHMENLCMVQPHKKYFLEEVMVETLQSTDEGVAFLVTVDGMTIYHGGDLHWWHWNGEPEEVNQSIAVAYQREIDSIQRPVDVAFIPVDLRLEENFLLGLEYFMKQVPVKHVFPMHFWGRFQIWDKMRESNSEEIDMNKIAYIQKKNEKFAFCNENITNS